MNLLDRAVKMAAELDEPEEMNFVRKHSREQVNSIHFVGRDECCVVIGLFIDSYPRTCSEGRVVRSRQRSRECRFEKLPAASSATPVEATAATSTWL